MKNKYILLVISLLVFSCTKKDDANIVTNDRGEIEYLSYNWKVPLHFDGFEGPRYNPSFGFNMEIGGDVLINTTNSEESRGISKVHSETGEILWTWSDMFQPKTEDVSLSLPMTDGNVYSWVRGTRHYTIDLETGESILRWRDPEGLSFGSRSVSFPFDRESAYYVNTLRNADGIKSAKLFRKNLLSSNYSVFLEAPYDTTLISDNKSVHSIFYPDYFKDENLEYIVCTGAQPYSDFTSSITLNLYCITTQEWIYSMEPITEAKQNNNGSLKVYDDKCYVTAGKEMFCYDILSGEQIWKRDYSHDFTFSGFDIADDILVANCENQICYGINIETGAIKWESEGSGTSSLLRTRIMNGIVYFAGGGPAYLFAKDIQTGETIWRLDPLLYENNNGIWKSSLNVVPGKNGEPGKVIAVNSAFAYCFDAAR